MARPFCLIALALLASSARAQVRVDPTSLSFGNVRVGQSSGGLVVDVENQGSTAVTVTDAFLAGPNGSDFATEEFAPPVAVDPAGSASVTLRFSPSAVGARSATLVLLTDDPARLSLSVALAGVGTSPRLGVAPPEVSFGPVRVGETSSPVVVALSNTGVEPLELRAISVSGSLAAAFAVAGVPATLPASIAPRGQLPLEITFTPSALGLAAARLTVVTDEPGAGAAEVPLDGEGVLGELEVSPLVVDFGSARVGSEVVTRTVEARNAGTAPIEVLDVSFSGACADAFLPLGSTSATLAPGGTVELAVAFAPMRTGWCSATMSVRTDVGGGVLAGVVVAGTGVIAVASLSPASLDFGAVRVGDEKRLDAVVRNVGTLAMRLAAPTVQGADAARFGIEVEGHLDPMQVGEEARLRVTFLPQAIGAVQATVEAQSPDRSVLAPVILALSGTGAEAGIAMEPDAIDFGTVSLGGASEPKSLKVRNTGGVALALTRMVADGPEYVADDTGLPSTLEPGASAEVSVVFRPFLEGVRGGRLKLGVENGPDGIVVLTGTGKLDRCGCASSSGALMPAASMAMLLVLRRRSRRPQA